MYREILVSLIVLCSNNLPQNTNFYKPNLEIKAIEIKTEKGINPKLWEYLRKGLNFVEASGKDLPPDFVHPGNVAYGPLALSKIAVKDVLINYENLSQYTNEEVFSKKDVYEIFAKAYAELLLTHYIKANLQSMRQEEIFGMLQKAWFLGPNLYKDGTEVIPSRNKNAAEYIMLSRIQA